MREHMARYQQITEDLRDLIKSGQLNTGDLLPSEKELVDTYSVSRMTVRKALSRLEYEGLIHRQPGRGTFVAPQKARQTISPVASFSEKMKAEGRRSTTEVLETQVIKGSNRYTKLLQVDKEVDIFKVVRLRYLEDAPAALQLNYVPMDKFPGIQYMDFRQPFTKILQEVFQVEIASYTAEIQPVIATDEERELLQTARSMPLLLIESTSYDRELRPIRFSKNIYRGDKFRFVVNDLEIKANKL